MLAWSEAWYFDRRVLLREAYARLIYRKVTVRIELERAREEEAADDDVDIRPSVMDAESMSSSSVFQQHEADDDRSPLLYDTSTDSGGENFRTPVGSLHNSDPADVDESVIEDFPQ